MGREFRQFGRFWVQHVEIFLESTGLNTVQNNKSHFTGILEMRTLTLMQLKIEMSFKVHLNYLTQEKHTDTTLFSQLTPL